MYIKKILTITALLGLVALGIFSYSIYQIILSPNTSFSKEEQSIYISDQADFQTLVDSIAPYLKSAEDFITVAQKKQYPSNMKSGHFVLKNGMNNNEIVNTLRSTNVPININFNNQHNLSDLSHRLSEQLMPNQAEMLQSLTDSIFLAENNVSALQSLAFYIPNTYEFYWNSSAEDIRERLHQQYLNFWTPERTKKRKALNLSPIEVSTLASIVQKETAQVDERPKVAGVYINRLRKGMRLQADPTLIFALKQKLNNRDTIIKRVLNKDKLINSPFNTYKYSGLPPAPIAMPDVSSLDAVLNYEKHDYLYFVADIKNIGYHKFSKTLRQHNRYANEYRRWINNQKIYR